MKNKFKTKLALSVMTASTTLSPLIAFADDKTLPDGGGLRDWILKIVGTLLIAYLAVGLFKDFVQQKWGAMIGQLIGGILVGWVCYSPDSFMNFLKTLVNTITGG